MPDFGTPVAQNINTGAQNLQTLSGLLGIQQQQAQVASAQAQAQQDQQKNQELQQAQGLAMSAKNGAYRKPDGSFDPQAFSKDVLSIGPYAAANAGQIMATANEMVQNTTAINDLNVKQKAQASSYLLSAIKTDKNGNPINTYSDVVNAVDGMVSDNPQLQRLGLSIMGRFHPSDSPEEIAQALKQAGNSFTGQPPVTTMGTVQTKGGIQPVQMNPLSTLPIGPQGQPIANAPAPSIQVQPGTGAPAIVSPSGAVTPIGQNQAPINKPDVPPQTNWWNPAPGQAQMLTANTAALVQRTQSGIQAANTSPQAIDSLERIGSILDQGTWTGTAFSATKDLKNLVSSLTGQEIPGTQNASEMVKNMARYEAARAGAVGNTDAARTLVESGSPNYKMDSKAVKAVVQQCLANEQIIQSYGNLMESTQNPQEAMQRESQFRSIPHLLQMFELGNMKSKSDVDAFLKRYDLSGATLAKSRQMYDQLMQGVQAAPGRAKGGPVGAGDYIVGEKGKEKLHLEPGSFGYVTPNKKAAGVHRLFGGPVMGPIAGPYTPMGGNMSPTMNPAKSPIQPAMGQQPMTLNNLMQAKGFGGRYGMVR